MSLIATPAAAESLPPAHYRTSTEQPLERLAGRSVGRSTEHSQSMARCFNQASTSGVRSFLRLSVSDAVETVRNAMTT